VEAFLARQIKFTEISRIIEQTLAILPASKIDSLQQVLDDDAAARQQATDIIKTCKH
jgi:1-deoxy-D-xylulose-5-phosphate reductoisomerase